MFYTTLTSRLVNYYITDIYSTAVKAHLPRLGAAVVSSEGEFLRDRVRKMLHCGDRGRRGWSGSLRPIHLIVGSSITQNIPKYSYVQRQISLYYDIPLCG